MYLHWHSSTGVSNLNKLTDPSRKIKVYSRELLLRLRCSRYANVVFQKMPIHLSCRHSGLLRTFRMLNQHNLFTLPHSLMFRVNANALRIPVMPFRAWSTAASLILCIDNKHRNYSNLTCFAQWIRWTNKTEQEDGFGPRAPTLGDEHTRPIRYWATLVKTGLWA